MKQASLGGIVSERVGGYAFRMRQHPTKEEISFIKRIKKVLKEKYPYLHIKQQAVFQHPFGYYIVDSYLPQLRLGFEIDGGYHWNSKQLDKDLKRDYFFDSNDVLLIHIPNSKLNNQRKRKGIEIFIEKIIEKRIGEVRQKAPLKYKKLEKHYRFFLQQKLISVLRWYIVQKRPEAIPSFLPCVLVFKGRQ